MKTELIIINAAIILLSFTLIFVQNNNST